MYDGNGNVGQMIDGDDGELEAFYEYDPFGNLIKAEGAYATVNQFRFSTKYFDDETGLYYYGHRYYSHELGRWLTRDPIREVGHELQRNAANQMSDQFLDLKTKKQDDSYRGSLKSKKSKKYKDFDNDEFNQYRAIANNPINVIDLVGLKVYFCGSPYPHVSVKIKSCKKKLNGQWGFGPQSLLTGVGSILWWVDGAVTSQSGFGCVEIYSDDTKDEEVYNKIVQDVFNPPCYILSVFNCIHWAEYVIDGSTAWRHKISLNAKKQGLCL